MSQTHFHPVFIPRVVTFTRIECQDPSQLFWYSDRINFQSYNFLTDKKKWRLLMTLISLRWLLSIWWLVTLVSLFIGVGSTFMPKSIVMLTFADNLRKSFRDSQPAAFGQHKLNRGKHPLVRVYAHQTNSFLEDPVHHVVRNMSVLHAWWWHRIAGEHVQSFIYQHHHLCRAMVKKRGTHLLLSDLKTCCFLAIHSLRFEEVGE